MTTSSPPTTSREVVPLLPPVAVLGRVYAASLLVDLPLLALMLTPALMRSRAGSEALLTVGLLLLLVLVVAAVVVAPEVAARVAPAEPLWGRGRGRTAVRQVRRERPRRFARFLGEFVALYLVSQLVGGVVAWVMPHIWANPAYGLDPGAGRWVLDYPNYAAQAVSMYVVLCAATAWYGCRIREEALGDAARCRRSAG